MSGILDNKSRIIDAIITTEGRRQIADGNFVIKFVTFSDTNVYYQKSENESHEDPTSKIYLESFNAPHDQIIFESDDSGNLIPFKQHEAINSVSSVGSTTGSLTWINLRHGRLKQNTSTYGINFEVTGSFESTKIKDNNFASQIEGILTSSIDNFKKLNIIGSKDNFFEDYEFALNNNEITFTIPKNSETLQMQNPTDINTIDALFNDEKLRNVNNFKYLPPIKKSSSLSIDKTDILSIEQAGLFLGNYPPWGPIEELSYKDIKKELSKYEDSSRTVYFDPTSRDNEIVAQMFEISPDIVSKLDVIEYGKVNNNSTNPFSATHHIFFVGKVLIDDRGSTNFVHLFTLVFQNNEESNV